MGVVGFEIPTPFADSGCATEISGTHRSPLRLILTRRGEGPSYTVSIAWRLIFQSREGIGFPGGTRESVVGDERRVLFFS